MTQWSWNRFCRCWKRCAVLKLSILNYTNALKTVFPQIPEPGFSQSLASRLVMNPELTHSSVWSIKTIKHITTNILYKLVFFSFTMPCITHVEQWDISVLWSGAWLPFIVVPGFTTTAYNCYTVYYKAINIVFIARRYKDPTLVIMD